MGPDAVSGLVRRTPPGALTLAAWCWLGSAVISLVQGIDRVVSFGSLTRAIPVGAAAASGLSEGQLKAVLIVVTTIFAVAALVFVVVPLRYAFALRHPGHTGHRARTLLTVLAAVGVTGIVVGAATTGVVPFRAGSSVRDLLGYALDLAWLLAVLIATVAAYTAPARNHLRRPPLS